MSAAEESHLRRKFGTQVPGWTYSHLVHVAREMAGKVGFIFFPIEAQRGPDCNLREEFVQPFTAEQDPPSAIQEVAQRLSLYVFRILGGLRNDQNRRG